MAYMQSQPMAHFRLLFLATCLFLSDHLNAQHMNAPDAPCQAPASNAETTACFVSASKVADEQLNKIYVRIREVLSADEQQDLQEAQRLWLKFRDANCSAERNLYAGGSAAPMVYAACVEADTRQRTSDLKAMYGWRLVKFGKAVE
ncbi:MAG: lysozyme inhibitor LprI family protein [Terriglobales bacterium]